MEQLDILLPRHTLEEALGPELAKQYRIKRGEKHLYMPVSDGSRYLCSCGQVNTLGEPCKACGAEPELLDRAVLEALSREAEERLRQEEAEAARQEQLRLEAERQKKRKKRLKICLATVSGLAALALCAVGFWWVTRKAIPWSHYQKAQKALTAGDYQLAHREFTLAGDYGDAATYLERFATPCLSIRSAHGNFVTLTQYSYDENGRQLGAESRFLQENSEGELLQVRETQTLTQRYDANGNWILQAQWHGHTVCVYNERGDLVSEEFYRADGQHENTRTFNYTYDDQGRVQEKVEICSEHISVNYSYEYTERFTYDERGNVAAKTMISNYPAQANSCYRADAQWRYNESGDPVEMVEYTTETYMNEGDSVNTKTWEYDEKGRLVKTTDVLTFINDPSADRSTTVTYTYDAEGRLLRSFTQREFAEAERNSTDQETWEYNWEGKLVKNTLQLYYRDDQRQRYSGYQQTITYTYDLLGRKSAYEMTWQQGEHNSRVKETYRYGADGMLKTMEQEEVWDSGRAHGISHYNENGLLEKMVYTPESDPTDQPTTNEYTYAYFYYPEGKEKPQELDLDIIHSYPLLVD